MIIPYSHELAAAVLGLVERMKTCYLNHCGIGLLTDTYFKHLILFVDLVGTLSMKLKSFVAPVQVVMRSMSKPRKLILFHGFTTIDIIYYIAIQLCFRNLAIDGCFYVTKFC